MALKSFNSPNGFTVGSTTQTSVIDSNGNITTGNANIQNLTGNLNVGGFNVSNISNVESNVFIFDTSAGIEVAAGQMAWNSADGTLNIGLSYANVVLQVGQETHYVVRNDTGNIIQNGTAVYCSGVAGGSGRIEASPMMGNIDPVQFLGLATQDINNGVNGVITYFGYVRDLDTRGTANTAISVGDENWAVGDKLYVHPTAPGKLTKVEPAAPNVKICVSSVIIRNQTSGVLFVRPTTNLTAADLSDVQITSPASDQILLYDNNRWENVNFGIDIDTTPTLGGNLDGGGYFISNVANVTANNLSARIIPRVVTVASSATPTPNGDTTDQYEITALAVAATIGAPTGTPVDGQKLTIRILDDGTPQTLAWNAIYEVIGTTLPTTTVANKYIYVGCIYNAQSSKWDVVSVASQV